MLPDLGDGMKGEALGARVPAQELVELAAGDSDFYCRTFFPKTFRVATPGFHRDMWDLLEDREKRYVGLEVFRGGAKTTTLRAFTSKRIAYGVSRTVLFVSASQGHSMASIDWLRRRVEEQGLWAQTFGLVPGEPWTAEKCRIESKLWGHSIMIVAAGITGQVRGLNVEDYRPDLIVVDDACDEENTATVEARGKISQRFFGALQKGLISHTENPDAKMVMLQTSLDKEDLINSCHLDPQWATRKYSCFDEAGNSRWPALYPKETLLKEKESHYAKGPGFVVLWLREMECQAVAAQSRKFKEEWLRYWDVLPEGMVTFLGVDPVPPQEPSGQVKIKDTDFEVLSVIGVRRGNYYLLEQSANRGHDPGWTVSEFFRLVDRWHPLRARVEGTAYQKTLAWLLRQEMQNRKRYVHINAPNDRRKKVHRIVQALSGLASEGRFFCKKDDYEFIAQFVSYDDVKHDDHLDSVAMALDEASEVGIETNPAEEELYSEELLPVGEWRAAP